MRYASSLLYGGMLVDAVNADYKDYSRLLLRCPFCGEAVHLSQGAKRPEHARLAPKSKGIVLVKESEIPAHFTHFSGVKQRCEMRAKSVTQKDIDRKKVKSKNQRLKIFQQRFWQIVIEGNEDKIITLKESIRKANNLLSDELIEDMRQEITEHIISEFKALPALTTKEHAHHLLNAAKARPEQLLITQSQEELDKAVDWLSSLELDLHLQIVAEAADFLKTKSANKILNDFVDLANNNLWKMDEEEMLRLMSSAKPYHQLAKDYKTLLTNFIYSMIAILAGTKWAVAIEETSK